MDGRPHSREILDLDVVMRERTGAEFHTQVGGNLEHAVWIKRRMNIFNWNLLSF